MGEGESERERERSLGFQIWGFGRENERAVGMWDEIYIQNYILYFTKLPHAPISFFKKKKKIRNPTFTPPFVKVFFFLINAFFNHKIT